MILLEDQVSITWGTESQNLMTSVDLSMYVVAAPCSLYVPSLTFA